jgi:hypothetical protein
MTMVVRGRVRRGRLVVDEPVSLPENTDVALAVIPDDGDDLDAEDRARLHEALRISAAELERGEVFPIEQVLTEL